MTMGDNLEKVKENLTPKGLNPESPDKFVEESHTEIENLKSQLAESEAQKLECIEDEIVLHKKHQELQKKVFGQSIKVTYFETLAKCYKDLYDKSSSDESKADVV